MKTKIIISIVLISLFGILFTSCVSDAEILKNSENSVVLEEYASMIRKHEERRIILEERREQNKILCEYLKLDGNKYVLQLSEEDALGLGISRQNYLIAKEEIENANSVIENAISKGGRVRMFDIQKRARDYKQEIKNDNSLDSANYESKDVVSRGLSSSGTIFTNGGETLVNSFLATGNKIRCRCRTAVALVAVYTCTVSINGSVNTEIGVGSILCTRRIDVNIPGSLSGDYGQIAFSTSDSNGGSCYWTVM